MSGRNREPSTTLPSGSASDRSSIFSSPNVGNIFYNTDTSNVEIYHQDPSNNAAWRDLVVNNREVIDISGYLTLPRQPKLTNQPHFLITSNTPSPTNINNGDVFPFNLTVLNPGSKFNVSGKYYEAPVSGYYRFTVNCKTRDDSTFGNTRFVRPRIAYAGGSTYTYNNIGSPEFILSVPPQESSSSMTWIQELDQGDRIRIHNVGMATQLWQFHRCYFMGELAFAN